MNIFLVVGFMIRKACCSPQLGLVRIEDLLHVRLDGLELLLTAHTASVPCRGPVEACPCPTHQLPRGAGRALNCFTDVVTYNPSTVSTVRGQEKEKARRDT